MEQPTRDSYVSRHIRFGWWSLLLFATLGFVLEALHGFKLGFYLDVANQTRRLMWTLAHAHGVLIGLAHLAFAATLHAGFGAGSPRIKLASTCLIAASVLLPGGFFVGGIVVHGGDPGMGVLLVPVGGLLLLLAFFWTARMASAPRRDDG